MQGIKDLQKWIRKERKTVLRERTCAVKRWDTHPHIHAHSWKHTHDTHLFLLVYSYTHTVRTSHRPGLIIKYSRTSIQTTVEKKESLTVLLRLGQLHQFLLFQCVHYVCQASLAAFWRSKSKPAQRLTALPGTLLRLGRRSWVIRVVQGAALTTLIFLLNVTRRSTVLSHTNIQSFKCVISTYVMNLITFSALIGPF